MYPAVYDHRKTVGQCDQHQLADFDFPRRSYPSDAERTLCDCVDNYANF